ncbi:glycosyl hydrolase, partial [bacterium]
MLALRVLSALAATVLAAGAVALGGNPQVGFAPRRGAFPLVRSGTPATVAVDPEEWPGVARAARDLQTDLGRVGGTTSGKEGAATARIVIGTIGRSPTIDRMVREGKLDVAAVRGRWEASVTEVVGDTLVVAGADKRGTIYALYDLAESSGVSPWNWWADVPVRRHADVYVTGRHIAKSPAVRYRGIFLNDEAPALTNWVLQNYGGYNHAFYERVFELLLRLRANYLWPAMWNNRFSPDDPLNPAKADEYGIVMGTSHVEPMMRADKEWNDLGYGEREWNYSTHPKELEAFWRDGVVRNRPYENIVTMAMRGKIDTPMSETANIALLERIVAAQRRILAESVNPDVTAIPQVWCLYKEVQEYYEKGMRVPDDVTLLWSDDNWGDLRRLPTPEERSRKGGAGVYYHFDYVGGPRNYKWIDTNPIPKIWEQMTRAHRYGADRIWIVNVGDLKPMEFPMEFFLTLARNPDAIGAGDLQAYAERWAAREFGPAHAKEIAAITMETRRLNGRRKPELLSPTTYSVENYR